MFSQITSLFRGVSLLSRSGVVRGAGTVAIGTAIGQGIVTLASPAVTRLYTPTQIGYFATLTALTNFFIAFVCFRLEQVILISDREERRDVVAVCLLSMMAVTISYVLVVLLTPHHLLNIPEDVRAIIAIFGGLTVAATGFYQLCQHLALRERRMPVIARYQVTRALVMTLLQIGLAAIGFGFAGLAFGQVAGLIVGVLPLLWLNRSVLGDSRHAAWRDMRRLIGKYRSFPLFGAPQSLLQATTLSMPVLMIGSLFGTAEAAIFWLGFRVFGLPSQVVIESVRASLLSNFAQRIRERQGLVRLWTRSSFALGALMLPLPLSLAFVGKPLFALVFGPQWASASTVTMILSFAWIAQNARVPSVVVLQLSGHQRFQLFLEAAGTIGRGAALSTALLVHRLYFVLILFVIVNFIQSLVTIAMTFRIMRSQEGMMAETVEVSAT